MRLFIAEKPELGRAIAEALGDASPKKGHIVCGDDTVTWCFGHMLALYDPEDYSGKYKIWSFDDLPMCFIPWKKKAQEKSKEQLEIIRRLMDRAASIVNAGDPDPEGQLLVDEIIEFFNCKKPVKRILINDNNAEIVKRAIRNMSDNASFKGLSNAAEARQVADQYYGYNMTRTYTLAARSNRKLAEKAADPSIRVLSVGRVQTPILGLVVRREHENKNHVKSNYYPVTAAFDFAGDVFGSRLVVPEDAPVDDKGRINDENYARAVAAKIAGRPATIDKIEARRKETPPPLPFNLLKLQSLAAARWGMKPDKVKNITQKLREEFRLITYNRSDCQYLSEEQHADAPAVIAAVAKNLGAGAELAKAADPAIKGRAFDSSKVSAHHAIIPTIATPDLTALSKDEAGIYGVIAHYYLMQFLPNRKYIETTAAIACEGLTFAHRSNKTTDEGWKAIVGRKEAIADDEEEEEAPNAPLSKSHAKGEKGECAEATATKTETKPQPMYTMATLLNDLTAVAKYVKDPKLRKILVEKDKGKAGERGGIGTSATRDELIKTLFTRGFIAEEKTGKKTVIVSTDAGKALYAALPDEAKFPDLTAVWHQDFKEIERGAMKIEEFIDKLMEYVNAEVTRIKAIPANTGEATAFCPKCKKALARRTGKNGPFWACVDRDDCGATFKDRDGKPDLRPKPQPSKTYICAKCGAGLVRRKSSKSDTYFWACSAYPKCKQTYNEVDNAPNYPKKGA
jgi:DNA topoisomerase-3